MSDHDKALRVPRQYVELAAGAVTVDVACPQGTRALHIGTSGNISATMKGGSVTAMGASCDTAVPTLTHGLKRGVKHERGRE